MQTQTRWKVAIVGGGLAGLSAAIYLGRALRRTVVIDAGRSLALWEPAVENYLGYRGSISGRELLNRARTQARRYQLDFPEDIVDGKGQVVAAEGGRTTVPGLYAAGCVTPANCQMVAAAGEGAAAAQAINRDLFEESLRNHSLRRFRARQLKTQPTEPEILSTKR